MATQDKILFGSLGTLAVLGVAAYFIFRKPISNVIQEGTGIVQGAATASQGVGSAISTGANAYADFGSDLLSISNPFKAFTDRLTGAINNFEVPQINPFANQSKVQQAKNQSTVPQLNTIKTTQTSTNAYATDNAINRQIVSTLKRDAKMQQATNKLQQVQQRSISIHQFITLAKV